MTTTPWQQATLVALAIIVGHNITVDWRLLHRKCPSVQPAGLLDTLRLARLAPPGAKGDRLTALLDRRQLTAHVAQIARGSHAHRALWDASDTRARPLAPTTARR